MPHYYPTLEEINLAAICVIERALHLRPIDGAFQIAVLFHTPDEGFKSPTYLVDKVIHNAIAASTAFPHNVNDFLDIPPDITSSYKHVGKITSRVVQRYDIAVDSWQYRIDLRYTPESE